MKKKSTQTQANQACTNNPCILIGIDPSYTRSGVCIINTTSKEIFFYTASQKIGDKVFENVVQAAKSVVNQLCDIFKSYKDYDLIMESPLPCSSMSPALYALGTLIYTEFESHVRKTYNPATLKSQIHGHKYGKSDSVNLMMKYLNKLSDNGYTVKSILGTKKKIPHDCAEALLYCHLYLHDINHQDFQFDNAKEIAEYKARMKELKKREKALLSTKNEIIGEII